MSDAGDARDENRGGGRRPAPDAIGRGQPSLFNPERPQALVSRYNRFIQNGRILAIRIEYGREGQTVQAAIPAARAPAGAPAPVDGRVWMSLRDCLDASEVVQTATLAIAEACERYESRIDEPAPLGFGGDGSEAALAASVASVAFAKRRAYSMSRREYERRYPNGWLNGQPADAMVPIAPQTVAANAANANIALASPVQGNT